MSALSAVSEEHIPTKDELASKKSIRSDRNLTKAAAAAVAASHKRNVSWDLDDDGNKKSESFLYQPELNAQGGTDDASGSGNMNGAGINGAPPPPPSALRPKPYQQRQRSVGTAGSNASSTQPGHVRKSTRITLTDITSNPLEDEAENAIIRALEARDWDY